MITAVLTEGDLWKYRNPFDDEAFNGNEGDYFYKFDLKDDEIMLSYDLCERLFGMKSKTYYTAQEFYEIEIPEFLGRYEDVYFTDYQSNTTIGDIQKLKIAGVFFTEDASKKDYTCCVNEEVLRNLSRYFKTGSDALVQTSSIDDLSEFLVDFRKNYLGKIDDIGRTDEDGKYMSEQYDFEFKPKYLYGMIMPISATIFGVILFLTIINLVSFNVLQRKKEIGILSALGMSNGDITKTFLSEVFIISAFTFIVDLILIILFPVFFNMILSAKYTLVIPYFAPNIWTYIILFLASFGFLTVSALLPLIKVLRLKPVDAIREV